MGEQELICYRCQVAKPLDAFIQRVDHRYYRMCRECFSEVLSKRTGKRNRLVHTDTERTCYLCLRVLPNASFTRRRNGTYFSACKDCNRYVFQMRRRARLMNALGEFTQSEWEERRSRYDACPGCNRKWSEIEPHTSGVDVMTVDHI